MKKITIDRDDDGVRLDRILRKALSQTSLSTLYRFIRTGKIKVNGKRIKQNYRVREGDTVEIFARDAELTTEKKRESDKRESIVHTEFFRSNFKIIYEDESLIVCNKPTGLVVHGGTGHLKQDTLIDCAISYIRHNSKTKKIIEPILVHRLDRDTSGVILIAKNKQTLRTLHYHMREHEIEKEYTALCHGVPRENKGSINLSLVKTHERNTGMKVAVRKGGAHSLSRYTVLGSRKNISHLAINLHTGKTHQIRVHMTHIGTPVIGDVRYGARDRDEKLFKNSALKRRLYLHAEKVSFYHPSLKRTVTFNAPVPKVFENLFNSL